MNELIVSLESVNPVELFSSTNIDDFLSRIAEEARKFSGDVSTEKGRKEIASFSYRIAQTKIKLDDLGKELVSDWKEKSKLVDNERKKARDFLDALKEDVRKPLTDFENAEKERVAKHESSIEEIKSKCVFEFHPTSSDVEKRLSYVDAIDADKFEEFSARATLAKKEAVEFLSKTFSEIKKQEYERAELERLKKEEDARKQKEREDQIAKEAAESERKKAEEALAKAEKLAQEKVEAEKQKAQAEIALIQKEKLEAENRAKQAAESERLKIKQEKEKSEQERVAREADLDHKRKINIAIVGSLMEEGLTEEQAKIVVTAIASGKVPAVKINY